MKQAIHFSSILRGRFLRDNCMTIAIAIHYNNLNINSCIYQSIPEISMAWYITIAWCRNDFHSRANSKFVSLFRNIKSSNRKPNNFIIIYIKKFRNSDWLRAVRLIPNSAILCYHSANLCYHSANLCYQCKFLLSQCKFLLSHFGGKKP